MSTEGFATGETATAPRPGWRIGDYDVLATLGKGAAGEVSLALRRGPHDFRKLVVLKLLHPHFEDDPEVVTMFQDEARLAGRLDHPGIVQTHEVGLVGDRHFMVMSYLEGIGLDRLLGELEHRQRRIPPGLAAWIVAEVLTALHYAHELCDHDGTPLEVVHRDVSPSNVFLCWDGTVKLIDFGIAKAAIRRASTDSGFIKGKWGYVAPEHATGENTDRRADVWSSGVVLWEMLSGERLFPTSNDITTLQALVAGDLPVLRDRAPDVPEALARVVDRALEHDVQKRYADADIMAGALRETLGTAGRRVGREDLAELLGDVFEGEREAQQVLLADLVGGALALSRTGSFGVSDPKPVPPARPEASPPGPVGSRLPLLLAAAAIGALTMIAVGGALGGEEAIVPQAADVEPPSEAPVPPEAAAETEAESTRPLQQDDEAEVAARPPAEALPRTGTRQGAPPAAEPVRRSAPVARAEEEPAEPEAEPDVAPGYLTFDTIPWSRVRVGERELGNTPLRNVELPPGEHELQLSNPEAGLRVTHSVVIRSGESTRQRIPLH